MFLKKNHTIIAEGLKISGLVQSEGDLEVRGTVDGEVDCSSVTITKGGRVNGWVKAKRVIVDGKVDGPIDCDEIVFNPNAYVLGDVECRSVVIEKGAFMEGRLRRRPTPGDKQLPSAFDEHGEQIAAGEEQTRRAELTVEARQLSGKPDLPPDEALAFLANRGNAKAKSVRGNN